VDDWVCLTLTRWSVSHGPLPTVSRVKDGENFPLLQQLKRGWPDGATQVGTGKDLALQLVRCMEHSGGASGRCRRGLRPATGPMRRRLRRSLSSRNRRGDRHTRSPLHRRPDGAPCGALLSRYCFLDVNIFICQLHVQYTNSTTITQERPDGAHTTTRRHSYCNQKILNAP